MKREKDLKSLKLHNGMVQTSIHSISSQTLVNQSPILKQKKKKKILSLQNHFQSSSDKNGIQIIEGAIMTPSIHDLSMQSARKKWHFIFTNHRAHMELFYPTFIKLANLAFRSILLVYISIYSWILIHRYTYLSFQYFLNLSLSFSFQLFPAKQENQPALYIYSHLIDPPLKKTKKQKRVFTFH